MHTLAQRRIGQRATIRKQQVEALRQQLRTLFLYAPPAKQCLFCHSGQQLPSLTPCQRHGLLVQTIDKQWLCLEHLENYLLDTATHIQLQPEYYWDLLARLPDELSARGIERRLLVAKQLLLRPNPNLLPHIEASFTHLSPFQEMVVQLGVSQPPPLLRELHQERSQAICQVGVQLLLQMLQEMPTLLLPHLTPNQLDYLISRCHSHRRICLYAAFGKVANQYSHLQLPSLLRPHLNTLEGSPQSQEIADALLLLLATLLTHNPPQKIPSLNKLLATNEHRVSRALRGVWEQLKARGGREMEEELKKDQ